MSYMFHGMRSLLSMGSQQPNIYNTHLATPLHESPSIIALFPLIIIIIIITNHIISFFPPVPRLLPLFIITYSPASNPPDHSYRTHIFSHSSTITY